MTENKKVRFGPAKVWVAPYEPATGFKATWIYYAYISVRLWLQGWRGIR